MMGGDCIVHTVVVGPLENNCYIVHRKSSSSAFIIDPGDEPELIRKRLGEKGLKALFIVNTHGHIDHIGADDFFELPVYIHRLDKDFLNDPSLNLSSYGSPERFASEVRPLKDGDFIEIDGLKFEVIHTPGHTPGGICLRHNNILFTGDTLFCQGVGRTDFPYGSEKQLYESIERRLFTLPDDTVIYPGHGPSSTIGDEKISR